MNCIVSLGVGAWHPQGVDRLATSLADHKWTGHFIGFKDEYPPGSPRHEVIPYGFKVAAVNYGFHQGAENVLWLDSSFWAVGNVEKVFEIISAEGYFLWNSGWNCAQWTRDKALKYFGISRDQAEKMPMISAGCLGLSRSSSTAMSFLDQWDQSMRSGVFQGSHFREAGDKEDSRYRGHRHDQSAGSILAFQHGMRIHDGDELVSYWKEDLKPSVCLTLRGM